ncbi:MAG TPA: hypothetical protein VGM93_06530 [Acidimicrobiales bacterium]|jgi:hypothetical protein
MRVHRIIGAGLLAVALVGCSSGSGKGSSATTQTPVLAFTSGSRSADKFGVCILYKVPAIKGLIGGGKYFRMLAPRKIDTQGGPHTKGIECRWERLDPNGARRSLVVDVTSYAAADPGQIDSSWTGLVQSLGVSAPVPGIGDQAVRASGQGSATVAARKGDFVVVVASQSKGKLKPVPLNALTLMANAAMQKVAP